MKKAVKNIVWSCAYTLSALVAFNAVTAYVGYPITHVKVSDDKTIEMHHRSFWVPFLVDVEIFRNKDLGFYFSSIDDVFQDHNFGQVGSYQFKSALLGEFDYLSGLFTNPGGITGKADYGLSVHLALKEENNGFPTHASKTVQDPVEVFAQHGPGFQVIEIPMDEQIHGYYVKYPDKVSQLEVWSSLVRNMDPEADLAALEGLLSKSAVFSALPLEDSQYWSFIFSSDQEGRPKQSVTISAQAVSEKKFNEIMDNRSKRNEN